MRRKCQQVDMDHCYSMPNEAPMRNSADVLRSSGFYQTRLLRKMKHSTDEGRTCYGGGNSSGVVVVIVVVYYMICSSSI